MNFQMCNIYLTFVKKRRTDCVEILYTDWTNPYFIREGELDYINNIRVKFLDFMTVQCTCTYVV